VGLDRSIRLRPGGGNRERLLTARRPTDLVIGTPLAGRTAGRIERDGKRFDSWFEERSAMGERGLRRAEGDRLRRASIAAPGSRTVM